MKKKNNFKSLEYEDWGVYTGVETCQTDKVGSISCFSHI